MSNSSKEFKAQSYQSYLAYVKVINGDMTVAEFVTNNANADFFQSHGITLTVDNVVNTLSFKMNRLHTDKCADGTKELSRKILSIASYRALLKNSGALFDKIKGTEVLFYAGKEPKEPAKKTEAEKPLPNMSEVVSSYLANLDPEALSALLAQVGQAKA